MKASQQRIVLALAGAALLGGLLVLLFRSGGSEKDAAPPTVAAETAPRPSELDPPPPAPEPDAPAPKPASTAKEPALTVTKSGFARVKIKAGQPIPELFPNQAERDRLIALGSTYDARNIPVIAPALSHSDATVREAARQALVQIGDASAVPYLKGAKDSAKDPEEAQILQETIDFLSLPHVIDVLSQSANAQRSIPKS